MDEAVMLSDARRRLPAAREALRRATGDMPASGTSQGSGGVCTNGGRTPSIALAVIDGKDQALTDSRRLDHLMLLMAARCRRGQPLTRQLCEVIDICDRWAPTERRRRAIDANLRAAADDLLNKHDDHGNCDSCKRVPGEYGEPHRKGLCKTCARHLDRVMALYDVVLELPPKRLLEIGKQRGKVTDQDIHVVMHGSTRRV